VTYSDRFDRRTYQRSSIYSTARYSADGAAWSEFDIVDLSTGGLRLYVDADYEVGARLFFHITVYGLSSEFEFRAEGVIRRKDQTDKYYVYGVKFRNLSKDDQIRIDEIITHMRPKAYDI